MENKKKRGNPNWVKGGTSPNPAGAPKRGESWAETFGKLGNMDRDEAAAYFGEKTDIGRQLKQLSPGIPLKDIIGIRALITLANDTDARLLGQVGDRIEGKPQQQVDVTSNGETLAPKVDDERFDRAISTLADALREGLPHKGTGANSEVDTPK